MNNLILKDDTVLIIQPKLVNVFGITESILLQQIHYWLQKSKNIIDGVPWIYNSYNQWHEQINFLSKGTIIRAIKKLEKMKVIRSANFNKMKMDRTKWYTIDYEMLHSYVEKHLSESENASNKSEDTSDKNNDNNCSFKDEQVTSIDTTIPKTTPEITPKEEEEGGFGQVMRFHKRDARNLLYIGTMMYRWKDKEVSAKDEREIKGKNDLGSSQSIVSDQYRGIHGRCDEDYTCVYRHHLSFYVV